MIIVPSIDELHFIIGHIFEFILNQLPGITDTCLTCRFSQRKEISDIR